MNSGQLTLMFSSVLTNILLNFMGFENFRKIRVWHLEMGRHPIREIFNSSLIYMVNQWEGIPFSEQKFLEWPKGGSMHWRI